MTVSYSLQVSSVKFGRLLRLLFRWRGSIFRLLLPELLTFMIVYYLISILYYFLADDQKRIFENIAVYCDKVTSAFPVTFVLGFYVSLVVTRWWNIYQSIPWPDRAAFRINAHIWGKDDQAILYRRTSVRYLNLMFVLCMRNVSKQVKNRFSSLESIKNAGLMTEKELNLIAKADPTSGIYWIPGCWYQDLMKKANVNGYLKDSDMKSMFDELAAFQDRCQAQISYDWISIPIAYTQVIAVAVYSYLFSRLLSDQYVPNPENDLNAMILKLYTRLTNGDQNITTISSDTSPIVLVTKYFPLFTWFQFFFYLGWLKVAEELLNPLGNDDEDFEINVIIDRNLRMSMSVVDDWCEANVEIEKDIFWGKPAKLIDAGTKDTGGFLGSLADKFEVGWDHLTQKLGKIDADVDYKQPDEIIVEQNNEDGMNQKKIISIFR